MHTKVVILIYFCFCLLNLPCTLKNKIDLIYLTVLPWPAIAHYSEMLLAKFSRLTWRSILVKKWLDTQAIWPQTSCKTHQMEQASGSNSTHYNWPVTCGPTTTKLWLNYWYSGVGRFASGGMKGSQHGNGLLILYGSLRAHSYHWRPNILTYVCRGRDCV